MQNEIYNNLKIGGNIGSTTPFTRISPIHNKNSLKFEIRKNNNVS